MLLQLILAFFVIRDNLILQEHHLHWRFDQMYWPQKCWLEDKSYIFLLKWSLFMSHLNFPGGELICQNIQKNPRPLVGKVAGESPVAKNGGRICQAWIRVCTWENEHEIHWNSVVFTSMTWSIEYKVSFELWIISSSFILNCSIPRLGSTLISHESMLPFGPAVKRLPLSAASKFWRIFLRTWHTSRGARFINIYHYAPCENGSCTMYFWCWCIQDSHKNMEYPVSLGCIRAQQEDTYRVMYHLPWCQSTPLTNVDPYWSESSTGILHMSLWIYFVTKCVYIKLCHTLYGYLYIYVCIIYSMIKTLVTY